MFIKDLPYFIKLKYNYKYLSDTETFVFKQVLGKNDQLTFSKGANALQMLITYLNMFRVAKGKDIIVTNPYDLALKEVIDKYELNEDNVGLHLHKLKSYVESEEALNDVKDKYFAIAYKGLINILSLGNISNPNFYYDDYKESRVFKTGGEFLSFFKEAYNNSKDKSKIAFKTFVNSLTLYHIKC